MNGSGYRYSTAWGFVVCRLSAGGGSWAVLDAHGRQVARASAWWTAMRWALEQRPSAGALAAPEPERETDSGR